MDEGSKLRQEIDQIYTFGDGVTDLLRVRLSLYLQSARKTSEVESLFVCIDILDEDLHEVFLGEKQMSEDEIKDRIATLMKMATVACESVGGVSPFPDDVDAVIEMGKVRFGEEFRGFDRIGDQIRRAKIDGVRNRTFLSSMQNPPENVRKMLRLLNLIDSPGEVEPDEAADFIEDFMRELADFLFDGDEEKYREYREYFLSRPFTDEDVCMSLESMHIIFMKPILKKLQELRDEVES